MSKAVHELYETTIVVDGNLEDDATQAVIEKVKTLIGTLGGEVKNATDNGRKKLAYKIAKSNIGYYVHIEFVAPPTAIAELERQYRLNEQVIRYLTIILDKPLLEIRERVLKYGSAQPVATDAAKPETLPA
jgi:small subunit ribosomal protein S6